MTESPALRRTIRRCTAVLVVVLGVIAANTDPYSPSDSIGYLIAYLAVGYLALSLFAGLFRQADGPDDDRSGDDGGETPSGDEGGSSDGEGPQTGDEEDDAEGTDVRPVHTYGGHF